MVHLKTNRIAVKKTERLVVTFGRCQPAALLGTENKGTIYNE